MEQIARAGVMAAEQQHADDVKSIGRHDVP